MSKTHEETSHGHSHKTEHEKKKEEPRDHKKEALEKATEATLRSRLIALAHQHINECCEDEIEAELTRRGLKVN